MRSFLVTHEIFRRPAFGRHHPLATRRQAAVQDLIEILGWRDPALAYIPEFPRRAVLERFHTPDYLDALAEADAIGKATADTRAVQSRHYGVSRLSRLVGPRPCDSWRLHAGVGTRSWRRRRLSSDGRDAPRPAGACLRFLLSQRSRVRDPALADAALGKVLHVDLDAHHSDGVEAAFADDPRVTLVSIHEDGRWPGTGRPQDTLGGRAFNVPVPRGINDSEYALVLERLVYPFVCGAEPAAIVVLLGADGLAGDPLSRMDLSNGVLWTACRSLIAMAPRVVVLGGGGYNPWTTARLWAGMWGF